MINQIFNTIFMTVTGFVQGLAAEQMLLTNEKTKRWFRLLYWTILALIPSIINVLDYSSWNTMLVRNIITVSMYIIAGTFFYKDVIWIRLAAIILLYFGMVASELSMLLVLNISKMDPIRLLEVFTDKTTGISVVVVGISTGIAIFFIECIVVIWKKVIHRGQSIKYFPVFIAYMLSHEITLVIMEARFFTESFDNVTGYSFFTSTMCLIALIAVLFSQSEKEALEQMLRKIKHKSELERISYQEILKRREKLLKFSTDNKKVIDQISSMLTNKDSKNAERMLEELLDNIESTREYPYCGIPIVNVVLWEKKKECDKYGINLDIQIQLPEVLVIEQVDICSILANLMDNAIRECKKYREGSKITINVGVVEKYIIIKCENTLLKEPNKIPEGTGYGFKILKDIANKYNGMFQHEYKNQKYYVQLSLQI